MHIYCLEQKGCPFGQRVAINGEEATRNVTGIQDKRQGTDE